MPGVESLRPEQVREALRLLGVSPVPTHRAAASRLLAGTLSAYGTVRTLLDQAPPAAREAFAGLVAGGARPVEDVLGRGWWGHGTLPPPLDWLQVRALVVVGDDGLLHPVDEARVGYATLTLDLPQADAADTGEGLQVLGVNAVVVAAAAPALNRALTVTGAALRAVAPTVAVSSKSPAAVRAALASAGVGLADDLAVGATATAPALPGTPEDAVGPRAIRALLDRAVEEQRQVRLEYFASSRGGAATERVVDPWGFGNDLLRGYCHLRAGERTFAVDRIGKARLLPSEIAVPESGNAQP